MSQVSYSQIAPLIAEATPQGGTVQVLFRCPVNGTAVQASAPIRRDESIRGQVSEGVSRRVGWGLKSALARTVRRAVGYGLAGSVASDAVYAATRGTEQPSHSKEAMEAAVIEAFEAVRSSFAWDAAQSRFVSAAAAGATQPELMLQLEAHPVTASYDRIVFARMLAEIAAADGDLGDDERAFFSYFITPDMGTLETLVERGRLTAVELGETTQAPNRDTMLLLAWSLALTDGVVDPGEAARLSELASGLGIKAERADELKMWAQCYLVDMGLVSIYASGKRDENAFAELTQHARNLGLADEHIERVDIRFRKRYSIA